MSGKEYFSICLLSGKIMIFSARSEEAAPSCSTCVYVKSMICGSCAAAAHTASSSTSKALFCTHPIINIFVFQSQNKQARPPKKIRPHRQGKGQDREAPDGRWAEGFKYQFLFNMSIVISEGYFEHPMEGEPKKQEEKPCKIVRKRGRPKETMMAEQQKKQNLEDDGSAEDGDAQKQSQKWSSEVIEPAIKTMSFRPKRGTRMKELMRGKHKKDQFWEKYQNYFGGDLNQPDDSDDQEDYQASSSGRDQFDSDFDLTDSYVGKRGRKKGTKVKRRKKTIAKTDPKEQDPNKPKGKRGRKKKVVPSPEAQGQLLKDQHLQNEENRAQAENENPPQEPHSQGLVAIDISSDHQEPKFLPQPRSSEKKHPQPDCQFHPSPIINPSDLLSL